MHIENIYSQPYVLYTYFQNPNLFYYSFITNGKKLQNIRHGSQRFYNRSFGAHTPYIYNFPITSDNGLQHFPHSIKMFVIYILLLWRECRFLFKKVHCNRVTDREIYLKKNELIINFNAKKTSN
ncbi:MAG: hypothetical protein K0R18_2821 [Bacillales bacterium]|jgi:hypothetical protein|nr:hypothetical protein [Bacillales bacterium]